MVVLAALMVWAVLAQRSAVSGLLGPDQLTVLDSAVAVIALALVPFLWSRHPVAVVLGLTVLAAVSPVATPAATAGTLQVARWFPLRTAVLVAVAGVAAHAVQALWRPTALPWGWWLLCDVAVHAALLGWGAFWQARAQVLRDLRERARRAETDRGRALTEARAAERNRIAAEMHDALGHRLSLLAATAGAVEFRPDAPSEQLAAAAGRIRTGAADALEDLRQLVRLLRDGSDRLAPPPTLADIRGLVDAARSVGTAVDLDLDLPDGPDGDGAPPAVATAAYRVVQEGLTNARRHAPGAAVRVAVTTRVDEVLVTVADDGPARPESGTPGTGLVGLRERVELLGGTLDAGRSPTGFLLDVRIPWR
ncbi:histidine kinase [Promicromonospora umidemergens]|uniref:histidine kinase n=1 Tax=Promicromonospora umidemergens TaxID=629679 RepID=A0ABP8YAS4_9MICO